MTVLSLFDGISCGMAVLERAGIAVDNYIAYEIDKFAIQTSAKNYPQKARSRAMLILCPVSASIWLTPTAS